MSSASDSGIAFSLIRGGLFHRLQERLGLIPPGGLGIARRAALFAAIAVAYLLPPDALLIDGRHQRTLGGRLRCTASGCVESAPM